MRLLAIVGAIAGACSVLVWACLLVAKRADDLMADIQRADHDFRLWEQEIHS